MLSQEFLKKIGSSDNLPLWEEQPEHLKKLLFDRRVVERIILNFAKEFGREPVFEEVYTMVCDWAELQMATVS